MRVRVDVVTADVPAMVDFYRLVGVDVPQPWTEDGVAHHVEVPDAGVGFNSRELTRRYDESWPDASGTIFIFELPSRTDVDKKFEELTSAGHRPHMEPIDAFWGSRYAIVDDPDGNHVGLMSPADHPHT